MLPCPNDGGIISMNPGPPQGVFFDVLQELISLIRTFDRESQGNVLQIVVKLQVDHAHLHQDHLLQVFVLQNSSQPQSTLTFLSILSLFLGSPAMQVERTRKERGPNKTVYVRERDIPRLRTHKNGDNAHTTEASAWHPSHRTGTQWTVVHWTCSL